MEEDRASDAAAWDPASGMDPLSAKRAAKSTAFEQTFRGTAAAVEGDTAPAAAEAPAVAKPPAKEAARDGGASARAAPQAAQPRALLGRFTSRFSKQCRADLPNPSGSLHSPSTSAPARHASAPTLRAGRYRADLAVLRESTSSTKGAVLHSETVPAAGGAGGGAQGAGSPGEAAAGGEARSVLAGGMHELPTGVPVVGRCYAQNWHAWLLGREMLVRFGGRFRGRIQRFTGLYMILLLLIFGGGITRLLYLEPQARSEPWDHTANSSRRRSPLSRQEANVMVLLHLLLLVVLLLSCLGVMVSNLASANALNRKHLFLLAQLRAGLNQEARAGRAGWWRGVGGWRGAGRRPSRALRAQHVALACSQVTGGHLCADAFRDCESATDAVGHFLELQGVHSPRTC